MSAEAKLLRADSGLGRLTRLARTRGFAVAVSLLLHVVMFAAFYAISVATAAPARRVIIPEARLAEVSSAGADQPDVPKPPVPVDPPPPAQAPRLDELQILAADLPGADPADAIESKPRGLALPLLDGPVTGSTLAPSGPVGPPTRFFGQTGNAYKVVYVIDVSASLDHMTGYISREMQESIRSLVPSQQFHIVLCKDGVIRELPPKRLVPANTRYKAEAYDFLRIIESKMQPGPTDPIDAMKRAFAARPELIYFLTDAFFQNAEEDLEAALKRMNAHGETRITVIGFDPFPATKAFLERIARDHCGNCRFVEAR